MSHNNYSKIIGYYPSWSIYESKDFQINQIPFNKITHLNYAFANIINGKVECGDSWADLEKPYKIENKEFLGNYQLINKFYKLNNNLKTLISIGGYTYSKEFSIIANNLENRNTFCLSAINFMINNGFDGIDIDWEFPVKGGMEHNYKNPNDGINFVLLLKELRNQMNIFKNNLNYNQDFLLTVATSASIWNVQDLKILEMSNYIDWFNVMTYGNDFLKNI